MREWWGLRLPHPPQAAARPPPPMTADSRGASGPWPAGGDSCQQLAGGAGAGLTLSAGREWWGGWRAVLGCSGCNCMGES